MQQQVQERLVERRQSQERNEPEDEGEHGKSGGSAHQNLAGRKRMIAMRSENDTSGAQVGAVTAMVSASLTPMRSGGERPHGAAEAADHDAGKDDAHPRIDLHRRERVRQREAHAGHRSERGREARNHIRAASRSPRKPPPSPRPRSSRAPRGEIGESQQCPHRAAEKHREHERRSSGSGM